MEISLQNTALEELAKSFSPELAKEFLAIESSRMEDKSSVLRLAKKLLVECDKIDEEICTSIDYLQCQVDHLNNQQEILYNQREFLYRLGLQRRFLEEFGDLRYLMCELKESLMGHIRYGKRTREIDEILLRLNELIDLAHQFRRVEPAMDVIKSIEKNLFLSYSARCANCSAPCLSAFRKVQVFLLRLKSAIQSTYEADSNNKTG